MTDKKITLHGPPITPELQLLFGHFGTVKGLAVHRLGTIQAQYEDGRVVNFRPELEAADLVQEFRDAYPTIRQFWDTNLGQPWDPSRYRKD